MRRLLRKPVRLVPLGFLAVILVGTGLLMLPWATSEERYTPFVTALFTSTSAVSVTGMAVTDTPNYWNGFGLVMITVLTQLGGLGILTGASLVILAVSRQLGLRNRLLVQAETAEFGLGDVRRLLLRIAATVFVTEALMTAVVAARLFLAYDYRPGRALWSAVFHSVQAFNNGGFALYSDGLIAFSRDGWVALPLSIGAIIGGLGFPALFEAVREWRQPARWAVATKLTIWGSVVLTVFGVAYLLMAEWGNPFTIGTFDVPGKLLASFTQIALSRTGGFDVINVGRLTDESYPMLIGLMFIGGGSASTAGGIKVSTFFLLGFAIWAELRGELDTTVGRRRVAAASQRQALTVALLSVALVAGGTVGLIGLTSHVSFSAALFEVTSAFSTTGLTVGVSGQLSPPGQYVLIALMYIGRVGPLTLGSAIALNTRRRLYRYPEEQPIVG
ncbi:MULTISPECIES: TrkH family potassium uptake protein [unclassified Micromonospora]|uniref:TrkH family potassium uptake protein n=1 Tax=unclassified Micromonospora TaxID=2617518 RepID=UPI00112E04C0|nr:MULTISPECIES: potassium transporter TrkG [unclassified Micromonospora]MCK1810100.1 TrkH family potassium uptake protein [Micromonospora sp. R42106]MCK1835268.1 TrkH family potassium uptake protein [Micromonospora sp. R42003]MCK1847092.1 TrkH family potassium uptake protein [Micromonospora sp. R42004]MCM1020134.1 TrkH family potassium uptake protein [Micromonospora sp. XM-20-01]